MNSPDPRYQGKPLLRLLECYVLWAIGQLSETELAKLNEMTPNLNRVYGVPGEWHEIIAGIMELPANMPELIQGLWEKNTEIARKEGVAITPQQFAELFVDQNLAP